MHNVLAFYGLYILPRRIVQDSSHLLYHLEIPRVDTKVIKDGERRLDSALSRGVMGNGLFRKTKMIITLPSDLYPSNPIKSNKWPC